MSIFSAIKGALSVKEKLAMGAVSFLVIGAVVAGVVWEHKRLVQATKNIGRLEQLLKDRDATISLQNTVMDALNDAQTAFHNQEVKDDEEQAKYSHAQEKRKSEIRKQMAAAGTTHQRLPTDTERLLQQSISEFNASANGS